MEQTSASRPPKGRDWYVIWLTSLGTLLLTGILIMSATGAYALSQRPEKLPDVPRPQVRHDGIHPAATQELTQPIRVTVANRHRIPFRNAIVTDIEESGDRVRTFSHKEIDAVAPKSYVERMNALGDNPDGSERRNGRYVQWTEEFAARDATAKTQPEGGEWTEFTVWITVSALPNAATTKAMIIGMILTIIPFMLILMSAGFHADLRDQQETRKGGTRGT